MPDEIPSPEVEPFEPYDLPGLGTVEGVEGNHYLVRMPDGRLCGFPAQAGEPTPEAAAADVAAWLDGSHVALQPPPPPPEPEPPPPPTVEEARAALLAALATRRWEVETGGFTVGGLTLLTDDRSKLLLLGAADQARRDAGFTTRWKTPAGWLDLDAATLIAACDAVLAHVQAAFTREGELAAQLAEAADLPALEALAPYVASFTLPPPPEPGPDLEEPEE